MTLPVKYELDGPVWPSGNTPLPQDFLDDILNSIPEAVVVLAPDGSITRANAATLRMLGFWEDEIIGRHVDLLFDKPMRREYIGDGAIALQNLEKSLLTKDGEAIPVLVSLTALRSAEGRLKGFVCVAVNIRERKAAEEAIERLIRKNELILNSAGEGIVGLDRNGRHTFVNPVAARMLGYGIEEMIGQPSHALIHHTRPDGTPYPKEECPINRAYVSGQATHGMNELLWRKDGTSIPVEYTSTPISEGGSLVGAVLTFSDITERKKAERDLKAANEQLTLWIEELEQCNYEMSMLNEMGEMFQVCQTADEACAVVSGVAEKLFPGFFGHLSILDPRRNRMEIVASWGIHHSGSPYAFDDCWALRRRRTHVVSETDGLMCRHLQIVPQSYLCIPLMVMGETFGLLHLGAAAAGSGPDARRTVTEAKQRLAVTVSEHASLALSNLKLRETLREQSIRDPLTGLFNRRYLEETFERELKRSCRKSMSLSVIMADIDHFKRVNDTYGHETGDAVLRELGRYLSASVRGEDIVCRYGGEEFLLILPEASMEQAFARGEEIRAGVGRLAFDCRGETPGGISVSMGIATCPEHGDRVDDLLRAADAALYKAKSEGRNRTVIWKARK